MAKNDYIYRKLVVMRNGGLIILSINLILWSCRSGGDNKNSGDSTLIAERDTAEISFHVYEHNFGKVKEGEKVAYIFAYENKGPGNLVIHSVSSSCGCTVPKYDKKPIPPGGEGRMEVVFNTSGFSGMQTKTITVRSNSRTPVVILKIIAEINSD